MVEKAVEKRQIGKKRSCFKVDGRKSG